MTLPAMNPSAMQPACCLRWIKWRGSSTLRVPRTACTPSTTLLPCSTVVGDDSVGLPLQVDATSLFLLFLAQMTASWARPDGARWIEWPSEGAGRGRHWTSIQYKLLFLHYIICPDSVALLTVSFLSPRRAVAPALHQAPWVRPLSCCVAELFPPVPKIHAPGLKALYLLQTANVKLQK